jgi:hypothetical protein
LAEPETILVRYVLNSAVIPGPGVYRYTLMSVADARGWLGAGGPWVSRVGLAETALYIERVLGVKVPLSRAIVRLQPGDEALVVRRTCRVRDVEIKQRQTQFMDEGWEVGLLQRVE